MEKIGGLLLIILLLGVFVGAVASALPDSVREGVERDPLARKFLVGPIRVWVGISMAALVLYTVGVLTWGSCQGGSEETDYRTLHVGD